MKRRDEITLAVFCAVFLITAILAAFTSERAVKLRDTIVAVDRPVRR